MASLLLLYLSDRLSQEFLVKMDVLCEHVKNNIYLTVTITSFDLFILFRKGQGSVWHCHHIRKDNSLNLGGPWGGGGDHATYTMLEAGCYEGWCIGSKYVNITFFFLPKASLGYRTKVSYSPSPRAKLQNNDLHLMPCFRHTSECCRYQVLKAVTVKNKNKNTCTHQCYKYLSDS